MTQEQKEKIALILRERVTCEGYEWRVTDNYVYIGMEYGGTCLITQKTIDAIREVVPFTYNTIGSGFIILSDTEGINHFEWANNTVLAKGKLGNTSVGITGRGESRENYELDEAMNKEWDNVSAEATKLIE